MGISRPSRALPEQTDAESLQPNKRLKLTGGDRFNGIGELCPRAHRSEEHTSELQSQSNLVCRLLLEKKKHFICAPSRIVAPPEVEIPEVSTCSPATPVIITSSDASWDVIHVADDMSFQCTLLICLRS